MTKAEIEVAKRIRENINSGKVYGKTYKLDSLRYPYFSEVLYLTPMNNIGWTNFGSSANKNTLKDLLWIIETIFQMTPSEFEKEYECKTEKEIENIYAGYV